MKLYTNVDDPPVALQSMMLYEYMSTEMEVQQTSRWLDEKQNEKIGLCFSFIFQNWLFLSE